MCAPIKNKIAGTIKTFFCRCQEFWTPPGSCLSLYTYRITLTGIFVGILALYFGYSQLNTAFNNLDISQKQLNAQLSGLNAKAKIKLEVHLVTPRIMAGTDVTEPINLMIIPRNKGDYNTPTWEAAALFCSSVNILGYDSRWKKANSKTFIYKSVNKVLFEQAMFSDEIDSIGNFEITLPSEDILKGDQIIPIGVFATSGEKAEQVSTFVYLDLGQKESVVQYESFRMNNGEVLTDTKGCFSI